MSKKTILIFTGGGLAPALNPTLYGAVTAAQKAGFKILGGLFGWACLLDNGRIVDLTNFNLAAVKNIGGTFLRSSRTNPFNVERGVDQIKGKIKEYKIDCIIAIGGNDTMGAADKLFNQEKINIVGIPKTIDNDLPETYFTPGFPSAAYYYSSYIKEIRQDAAYALSRIYIIEAMGQDAGWLVASGIYGDADIIIPPEKEIKVENLLNLVKERYEQNGYFAVIAVAEQAKFDQPIQGIAQDQSDSFGVKRSQFISIPLRDLIREKLGINAKALIPGNYLETGRPIKIDQECAIKLGKESINLVRKGKIGHMAKLERTGKKIIVSNILLKKIFAKQKEKVLNEKFFDWQILQPTQAYLDYMEPILGKYQPQKKDKYNQLLGQMKKYVE